MAKKPSTKKPVKDNPKKNKGGRPTKFDEADKTLMEKLYKNGLTDSQVADCIGVTEQTINNWKIAHPKFFESLKDWKAEADKNVAKSLYHRACGYTHPEEKIFCHEGQIIRADTLKHYPPDATSMIFWLKNRDRENWRDRQDHSHEFDENLIEALKDKKSTELLEELKKRGIV